MTLMEPTRTPGQDPGAFSSGQTGQTGQPGPTGRTGATEPPRTGPNGTATPTAATSPERPTRQGRSSRSGRFGRAAEAGTGRRRTTIGAKIGVLLAALLAVLVASSVVLIAENHTTAREYDTILAREVRQGLLARQMQVEFKKRVQEWKDILLRGSDPVDRARYTAAFEAQDAKTDTLLEALRSSGPDARLAGQLQKFEEYEAVVDQKYAIALEAFVASDGKDFRTADRTVRGVDRPATDLVDTMVVDLEKRIAERVAEQERRTDQRERLTVIVSGALLVLIGALLVLALLRIVRPIRDLTRQAQRTAAERLPGAIARVKGMEPGEQPPALPAFTVTTNDELRDLASALTKLQDSALGQAVDQYRADRETADMLVNLGRRNQNLLGRMLSYVTELERKEEDPDVLSQLFRLDHATTRIRRNAESMLVLAGATQTRTWSRPVPVIDVVRAALSEIEEYIRVDLHHIEDGQVNGSAVADVVHLVAELVENATHFSPPTTQVTVVGQRVKEGYRIRVIDQGVGMTRRELDDANERIRRAEGGWSDSKLLGLYVVGRLARRRAIEVGLEASAGRGITASILLPMAVLSASGAAGAAGGAAVLPSAAALLDAPVGMSPGASPGSSMPPMPSMPSATRSTAPSVSSPSGGERAGGDRGGQGSPALPAPVLPASPRPRRTSTPALGWAEPSGPGHLSTPEGEPSGQPWSTLIPPPGSAPTPPVGEVGTFTAAGPPHTSYGPRPTIPAIASPAAKPTVEPNRIIDLTEPSGPGGPELSSAAPVPVQWFAAEAGGPANGSDGTTLPGGAPAVGAYPVAPARAGAPSGGATSGGAIPRRIRGAQLPDLGPTAEPVIARPEDGPGAAESLRWQLRSFQLDVQAARRAINEADPAGDHRPDDHRRDDERTDDHRGSGHHDDPAGRIRGHHHPEGE